MLKDAKDIIAAIDLIDEAIIGKEIICTNSLLQISICI